MSHGNDRESPAAYRTPSNVTSGDLHIVRPTPDTTRHLDDLAESLRGYLVLQVVVDDAGHRRTHLYRSAGAAQRAVERARARGREAHLTLCELVPMDVVAVGGVA